MYEELEPEPNPELELAETLKHDLGKYVAWRSANLPDAAWEGAVTGELLEALRADLLQTRTKGGALVETAWEVWRRCMIGAAAEFAGCDELVAVGAAVGRLASTELILREGDLKALAAARHAIRDDQRLIREQLRLLHRRLASAASSAR